MLREAAEWVADPENAELVGAERALIEKELRRGEIRARKLAEAAERPMCVGVYGPSQAGKSFLVSVLAKPRAGRLIADLPGVPGGLDFISEINPGGETESTGLVTRFTMRKAQCPAGFPVHLRLLSEADAIRILADSFFRDGDHSEPDPEPSELSAALSKARGRASGGEGLATEDIWEIQEYFERNFRGSSYLKALSAFWEEASEVAPMLGLKDRAELLSVLWGKHAAFTELYTVLIEALQTLGRPKEAFASVEALTPKATSVIDVATLAGLDDPGAADVIRVKADNGREAAIARPVIAALTAELVLPMAEQPWPLFAHSDLLDFPGVRERGKAKKSGGLEAFFAGEKAPKKELWLRGKVAFLFERYVAEQELTSMLLCIPDSNIEVAVDLSKDVREWISKTHGATPAERAQVETMLFFVLTKFDKHLVVSPTLAEDSPERFDRRIDASILAPFGGANESWPRNWTPGRPFTNTYWLRNPNYPAEMAIDYDENGVEIGYLEKAAERVARLKSGALRSELVQTHMRDPNAAWDAAMALNDGGVSYLVEHLTPVCGPEIKSRQIAARHDALRKMMALRLQPYYSDDDVEKRLKQRREVADRTVAAVNETFDARRFARLIEAFSVHPDDIATRIDQVDEGVIIVQSEPGAAKPSSAGPRRRRLPGQPAAEPAAEDAPGDAGGVGLPAGGDDKIRVMTLEAYQARTATLVWLENMRACAARDDIESFLHISPSIASEIIGELGAAGRRIGLIDRISADLRRWNFGARAERQTAAAALVAAEKINRLVEYLCVDEMAEADKPRVPTDTGERPAFKPFNRPTTPQNIADEAHRYDIDYLEDWSFGLYRMFEDNARNVGGANINQAQNARLGSILTGLGGAEA